MKLRVITGVILIVVIMLAISCTKKGERREIPKSEQLSEGVYAQPHAFRALSLRVLNETLEKHKTSGDHDFILRLCGITKFYGFVVDEGISGKEGDVILIGEVDDTLPPLYLDDFVIALRNAWWKYAILEGNTYYYSPPGCSIDPDSNTLMELQQIAETIFRNLSPEKASKAIQKWNDIGSRPQKVRVMGIPRDSRFAKVIVDAGYYAKRLVDGSVSLDIEGFTSLVDMTLNKVKEDIIADRQISIPAISLNRFWFFPGENSYAEDEGVILIKRCEVKLLTEQEFLTHSGNVTGSGMADPLAQKFADVFTEKYEEVAQKNQIYAEQESLFRFVSLAKAMKHRDAISQAGINLDYLLDRHPVGETPVPQTLPGITNVKEFRHEDRIPGGVSIARLWLPSCGGVSIDITPSDGDFVKDEVIDPNSSAHFRMRDLRDPVSLASKLRNPQDPVSQHLREQFSPNTRKLLDAYDGVSPPSENLQRALVDDLNRVLHSDSLYDKERFSQVNLDGEIQKLIEQKPQGKERVRLNRSLLQEAYPKEIRKSFINVKVLKDDCLKARPSSKSLYWDFPTPGKVRRPMPGDGIIVALGESEVAGEL